MGPPKIPANATLKFEVELLSFNDKKNVTDDEEVRKKVILEGHGFENPAYGGTVEAKITGRIGNAQGTIFAEVDTKELKLDDSIMCHGLELAFEKMKRGERSHIYVNPTYGFGSKGNAELKVPANAALFYDVEIISFVKPKDSWDMDIKEKLDTADGMKASGNKKFGSFMFKWALKSYEDAENALESLEDATGEDKKRLDALRSSLARNMASCYLKLKNFAEVISKCDDALQIDSNDAKALFKRGQAFFFTNDLKTCLKDFSKCQTLDPSNNSVAKYIRATKKKLRKIAKEEQAIYGGM